jgi:integrase
MRIATSVSRPSAHGKYRGKTDWRRSAPTTVNSLVRTREYLTGREVERLMAAARKGSRWGHRDATMILIGYRHGLRASELCDLQWSQVELSTGRLHVRRAKRSPSVHPTQGDEIRALRRLQREQGPSSHVFMTERGGPDDAQGVSRSVRPDRHSRQDAVRGPSAYAPPRLRQSWSGYYAKDPSRRIVGELTYSWAHSAAGEFRDAGEFPARGVYTEYHYRGRELISTVVSQCHWTGPSC